MKKLFVSTFALVFLLNGSTVFASKDANGGPIKPLLSSDILLLLGGETGNGLKKVPLDKGGETGNGLFTPRIADKGGETGNGGLGKLCRKPEGKTLRTLDLFEADLMGQKLVNPNGKSEQELSTNALNRLADADPAFAAEVQAWAEFYRETKLPVSGFKEFNPFTRGKTTEDELITFDVDGCVDVQIVNWLDSDDILFYNHRFSMLSNLDKAALELHEGIYRTLRQRCSKDNSLSTRTIVRKLFAEDYSADEVAAQIEAACKRKY